MANVQISKWEVAEMFGLEYLGEIEVTDKWHDTGYAYQFKFRDGGTFLIDQNGYDADNLEQGKEWAAEKVLAALGKLIVVN